MGSMFPMIQFYFACVDIQNESLLNLSIAETRQNAKISWKTYELFIYGGIHYITNSFLRSTKNSYPTSQHYALHSLQFFVLSGYFIAYDTLKKVQIKLYIWWYIYLFFFSTVYSISYCSEADQILPSCPHHITAEQDRFMCGHKRTFWTWSWWYFVWNLRLWTKQPSVTDMFRKTLLAQRY